jgi:uncharacterized protein with PIN domain
MLGNLSRWLRFFGFDTCYIKRNVKDDELLDIAKSEKRILVSRDKELIIRARKRNLEYILIKIINLDEQLRYVLKDVDVDNNLILSRCSICNSNLIKINKEDFKDKIPIKIYNNLDEFLYCNICDKTYWKGTHYDKIIDKISLIKKDK